MGKIVLAKKSIGCNGFFNTMNTAMMKNKKRSGKKNINRRQAIVKTGKYAMATAAATFIILNPKQSQADSPTNPGWG